MNERELLKRHIYGEDGHVHLLHGLEGVSVECAGASVPGAPYTIFEVLNHMIFWQEVALERLAGRPPAPVPSAAIGWPGPKAPADAGEWEAAVARLARGLRSLEEFAADPGNDLDRVSEPARERTARQELFMAAGHSSYHFGQIALLRRQLGSWPPPKGGDTW